MSDIIPTTTPHFRLIEVSEPAPTDLTADELLSISVRELSYDGSQVAEEIWKKLQPLIRELITRGEL